MTLIYIRDGTPVLIECPVCGHYWPENYEGDTTRWKHLSEHDPEEFGLSPFGDARDDAAKPLFRPADSLPDHGGESA